MPYRLRYTANVDFFEGGTGPTQPSSATSALGSSGGAQTKGFINAPGGQVVLGGGTGGILQAADITTLLAAMSTDLSTQLNAALTQLDGFASGGG